MAVEKIGHYALTNPASVYDEEALTALELAGRTAKKVNEIIDQVNGIPEKIKEDVDTHIQNGEFDRQINEYIGNLETRIEGLFNQYEPGSTTQDAELYDIRTGADGTKFTSAGEAVRSALTMGNLVDGGNYTTKLPDANLVMTPNVYVLHFANGSTEIPANLPFTTWNGRIGLLMCFKGTYFRQIFIDDNQILTRNGTRSDNWSPWRALNKPEYIIDIHGNGDFSSILKALQAHPTNTRFIVKPGEYDVVQQYENVYGANYFRNYDGYSRSTDDMDKGLFLGDGVELIGEGYVNVVFNYVGGNDRVFRYFSVFSTSQNNVIDNINITIKDGTCRYLIHDDYASAGGKNIFRNICFKGYSYLGTAIGGGFGLYNTYLIENCMFVDSKESIAIAYHNNANEAKNTLIIRDCYCEGTIYLKHYGKSVQKSKVYVTNCRVKKIVVTHGDKSSFPNENMELLSWHNNLDEQVGNIASGLSDEITRAINRENDLEKLFTEPTEEAVGKWLEEHPELTTTVQNGSINLDKFTEDTKIQLIKEYVTPEMFGAVGDGVNDDSDAIINACNSNKVVMFSNKTYVLTKPVTLQFGTTLKGSNNWHTKIIMKDNATIISTPRTIIEEIQFQTDDFISGTSGSSSSITCINANGCPYHTIRRCTFYGFDIAIENGTNSWCCENDNVVIEYCNIGISGSGEYNGCLIKHCTITYCQKGIFLGSGRNVSIFACIIETSDTPIHVVNKMNLDISGCYFENNNGPLKFEEGTAGCSITNIHDCSFFFPDGAETQVFYFNNIDTPIIIKNNRFTKSSGANINVTLYLFGGSKYTEPLLENNTIDEGYKNISTYYKHLTEYGVPITGNENFDNIKNTFVYSQGASGYPSGASNSGYIINLPFQETEQLQIYFPYNGTGIYFRIKHLNSWGEWVKCFNNV